MFLICVQIYSLMAIKKINFPFNHKKAQLQSSHEAKCDSGK